MDLHLLSRERKRGHVVGRSGQNEKLIIKTMGTIHERSLVEQNLCNMGFVEFFSYDTATPCGVEKTAQCESTSRSKFHEQLQLPCHCSEMKSVAGSSTRTCLAKKGERASGLQVCG